MNCYVCTTESTTAVAIGTCPVCEVGLCLEHRLEQTLGAGGTAIECRHLLTAMPVGAHR